MLRRFGWQFIIDPFKQGLNQLGFMYISVSEKKSNRLYETIMSKRFQVTERLFFVVNRIEALSVPHNRMLLPNEF